MEALHSFWQPPYPRAVGSADSNSSHTVGRVWGMLQWMEILEPSTPLLSVSRLSKDVTLVDVDYEACFTSRNAE